MRCQEPLLAVIVPALVACAVVLGWCSAGRAAPSIAITNVPPFGSFNNLGGSVQGADTRSNAVAVFIYVSGAGWYSKPFCNPQLTPIASDGSWTADVTTGGSDQYATRFTALLVSTNYNQPCVQGPYSLPTNVTSQAIATTTATRQDTRLQYVHFNGYDWWLKSSSAPLGPGPNYFSDSTNNVWLDSQGQLHLRITNRSNHWQCAEVVSDRTFGYGNYRFHLAFDVNALDRNAVLGLFTWSDDPAYAHREIDIECSRWGSSTDASNAQYVVQPFDTAGHVVRYRTPPGATNTTHLFIWETNRVSFQSMRGNYTPSPASTNVITNWIYSLDVPQSGDENVRMNLRLNDTNGPSNAQELEVIVSSFEFVPLGTPQPATVSAAVGPPAAPFHLTIHGQLDRRYTVQASADLAAWTDLATILATNSTTMFVDSNTSTPANRFYRSVTLP